MKKNKVKKINRSGNRRLLIGLLKINKSILKKQQKLVNRYEKLAAEQKRYERLNRITRVLALGFIILRIGIYLNYHT